MSGNNLLLDTNIILYFLSGDETLIPLFEDHNLFISFITEIELLGYPSLENTELEQVKGFLKNCTVINLNEDIKNSVFLDYSPRNFFHVQGEAEIVNETYIDTLNELFQIQRSTWKNFADSMLCSYDK